MTVNTMTFTGELVITSCWCGIRLAIPDSMHRWAQTDKSHAVHCPLGHEFVYSKNDTDRANERAASLERQLRMSRESVQWERDQRHAADRSNAALRGWITRYRNRIAAGICPVDDCRRNFQNVARHIERMHPDWAHEHPEALA